jgi:hypothetical protein
MIEQLFITEDTMTRERFQEIMEDDSDIKLSRYKKNRALLGLNLMAKYLPNSGVEAADHDIIIGADIDPLLKAGLTEEDAIELRKLNWMIHDSGDCMACFV